jgi:hypothetical protein
MGLHAMTAIKSSGFWHFTSRSQLYNDRKAIGKATSDSCFMPPTPQENIAGAESDGLMMIAYDHYRGGKWGNGPDIFQILNIDPSRDLTFRFQGTPPTWTARIGTGALEIVEGMAVRAGSCSRLKVS